MSMREPSFRVLAARSGVRRRRSITLSERGQHGPGVREAADLFRRGIAARLAATFPGPVRASIASTALGLGVGFAIAYFGAYAWVRPDGWGGTVVSGAVWVPVAWLVLTAGAVIGRPLVRVAGWVLAVALILAMARLRLGPFIIVPWTTWGSLDADLDGYFGVVPHTQALFPNGGTIAVLVVLATLTLVGPVRRRRTAIALVAGSVFFATAFGLLVTLARGFDGYSDYFIWQWPDGFFPWPPPGVLLAQVGVGPPALAVVLVGVAIALRHRSTTGSMLAAVGAAVLTIGVIAAGASSIIGISF